MTIRIRTDVAAGHVSAYQLHWLSGLAGRVGLAPGRGLDPAILERLCVLLLDVVGVAGLGWCSYFAVSCAVRVQYQASSH